MNKNKKSKILIVEDDPNFISILKQKFEEEGFLACTAQDGKEGFEIFSKESPDLAVLDVLLPLMNGIDLAKKILQKRNIPVLMLTNVKDESYSDEAKKLKGVEYLIKSDMKLDEIIAVAKERL